METAEEFIQKKREQVAKERTIEMKDIGRRTKRSYIIDAATFMISGELNRKVFVFERLRILKPKGRVAYKVPWHEGKFEYRIGYYIIGQINARRGKWTWGQFTPMISHDDLFRLLDLAKKEGTIKE